MSFETTSYETWGPAFRAALRIAADKDPWRTAYERRRHVICTWLVQHMEPSEVGSSISAIHEGLLRSLLMSAPSPDTIVTVQSLEHHLIELGFKPNAAGLYPLATKGDT